MTMPPLDQIQGQPVKWGQSFTDGQIKVTVEVDGQKTAIKVEAERHITDLEWGQIISVVRHSLSIGPIAAVIDGKAIPQ